MEFTDQWKSLIPVGKFVSDPSSRSILGPLLFNPNPQTLTVLLSSPSLFPPLLSPPPQLSLSRFLSTSSVPFSTSSSIASLIGHDKDTVSALSYNRLQLLHCPNKNSVFVFFPTGCNHDQVGYSVILLKESGFDVLADENNIFTAKNQLNHQICKILVNPIVDIPDFEGNSLVTVGYLLAFTMYSVHWFSVKVSKASEKPVMSYLGFKMFKSCSIVGACWSPYIPEQSVVMLQSGALFMFDMDNRNKTLKSNAYFKGKRLKVLWNVDLGNPQRSKWLGCEFSWHPETLIVAHSNSVFLVDFSCDDCRITLLAKTDMLSLFVPVEREQFVAFCKVGADGYSFVLASDSKLVLADVRQPLEPVLQCAHGLKKPSYIDSFRLSELRSNSRDNAYEWANKMGFGIILGSFWNCEFRLFCCGPSLPSRSGLFGPKISKFCKPLYAWDLYFQSDLWLSGRDCYCRSCLLRKEFSKDDCPKWINWQQKKDIVLGFGMLNYDNFASFLEADEFGGFTLIRLMSSGKLEAQRFCASWDLVKKLKLPNRDSLLNFEDNLLCLRRGVDYKFPKAYKFLKLDYLYGHLNGNLNEVLNSKMKYPSDRLQEKDSFSVDFHKILCEKLKVRGLSRFRTSPTISVVFSDISLPASIREIALKRTWAGLPMELLQLAFSSYTEVLEVLMDKKKVSLKFLVVPDLPQLPPFFLRKPSCHSNKGSQNVLHDDALVGPVLPLPILVTLHDFRDGSPLSEEEATSFSPDDELSLHCDEVMQVAHEVAVSDSGLEFHNDHAVSLADDRDESWVNSRKPKPYILYHPTAFKCSFKDQTQRNDIHEDVRSSNLISTVTNCEPFPKDKVDSVAADLVDDLCPIALKYDNSTIGCMPPEPRTYDIIKRQFSKWLEGFSSYQDFCTQFKPREQRA